MDRRERWAEPVEALRAALDGRQAEMWTALPVIAAGSKDWTIPASSSPLIRRR